MKNTSCGPSKRYLPRTFEKCKSLHDIEHVANLYRKKGWNVDVIHGAGDIIDGKLKNFGYVDVYLVKHYNPPIGKYKLKEQQIMYHVEIDNSVK